MKFIIVALASLFTITSAQGQTISGAGATFPYPVYAKWAQEYKNRTNVTINYQSIGSGAGIKQIKARTVSFGATDMPLPPEELEKDQLIQFPTVLGGVVAIYNIGIDAQLTLDGPTLARIYAAEIKNWNDPAIQKLNPNVQLPNLIIVPVYRSDGSGTTFVFTEYLSKVSETWKSKFGFNTTVRFPVGTGARGNEGVAAMLTQVKGAIGYVEYAFVKNSKTQYARMINAAGNTVTASVETFQSAAASANWNAVAGFGVSLTNDSGANSWPITSPTFILLPNNPVNKDVNTAVIKFFEWAFDNGDQLAIDLAYVPLPKDVKMMIKQKFTAN
jgi:phosphate transport system substrate-binding protein